MTFQRITEKDSNYKDLELKSIAELIENMHAEDLFAVKAMSKSLNQIKNLILNLEDKLKSNGRLFYIGAGTSGRLGVLDASECPPTFGVDYGLVVGLMAGGDKAMRKAVEFAEDNSNLGWLDLQSHNINANDVVVGIAASGTTPYVVGALDMCQQENILTACVVCNINSSLSKVADIPITALADKAPKYDRKWIKYKPPKNRV